jgi:hypothetical protein
MEATVKLRCTFCKKWFPKARKELTRQKKKGQTRFYCGRHCQMRMSNVLSPRTVRPGQLRRGKVSDALSPFRWFMGRARYRVWKGPTDLTLEYLRGLWQQQGSCCALTGVSLVLPQDSNGWKNKTPYGASLDRIRNSEGYVKGNVRFLAVMANLARQDFSDEEVITFCKAVAEHHH